MKKLIIFMLLMVVTIGAYAQRGFVIDTDQYLTAQGNQKPHDQKLIWTFDGSRQTLEITFPNRSTVEIPILDVQDVDSTVQIKLKREDGNIIGIIIYPEKRILAIGDGHTVFIHHITSIRVLPSLPKDNDQNNIKF